MNRIKKKSILVTGGAGFIGSHLVEKLVANQADVRILDNLSTGSKSNIKTVHDHVSFIQGDINDYQTCLNVTKNIDIVFHCAAYISVAGSFEDPATCYQTNIIGTLNLLQAAAENNVQRFLFSSSAAVYGLQNQPCEESMICKPESPYGHSKLMGELLCKRYKQEKRLSTVIMRYFNVFGPRQNAQGPYAGAIARFNKAMQEHKPITIFGDGSQTRDFIHVSNVINAQIFLACAPEVQVSGEVFNIASGKSVSLLQMLEQIKENYPHYTLAYNFLPSRTGDIHHSQADCSKFFNLSQKIINEYRHDQ